MSERLVVGRWKRLINPVVDERAVSKAVAQLQKGPGSLESILDYHADLLKTGAQFWRSPEYLVVIVDASAVSPAQQAAEFWWLRIYRHDGKRIRNHWSELQRIKTELVGPEHQGVEIYPPESLLQDGENSYHLWVFKSPTSRLPFGLPWPRSSGADGPRSIPTRFVVEGGK